MTVPHPALPPVEPLLVQPPVAPEPLLAPPPVVVCLPPTQLWPSRSVWFCIPPPYVYPWTPPSSTPFSPPHTTMPPPPMPVFCFSGCPDQIIGWPFLFRYLITWKGLYFEVTTKIPLQPYFQWLPKSRYRMRPFLSKNLIIGTCLYFQWLPKSRNMMAVPIQRTKKVPTFVWIPRIKINSPGPPYWVGVLVALDSDHPGIRKYYSIRV
jgi:hypothetical protein